MSATSVQNSSFIGPGGYNNSSITGPDEYQNSSTIWPDAYQNSSVTGSYAYITSSDTDTVAVIDTLTNNVTNIVDTETFTNKEIWRGGDFPYGVAVTPNGTEVYVTNTNSGTVSVIDTATNNLTAVVDVGGYARGVAVNPTGTKVYVASDRRDYNSDYAIHGTISVIDTATKNVIATIKVGVSPYGVAVSPDGTEVYVTNQGSGTVSVIDTITNKFKATIPVGNGYSYPYSDEGPKGVAVTPDGKNLYVTRSEYSNSGVLIIDTVTQTVKSIVNVGGSPYGIAVNQAGTKVYVTAGNGVSVIDTATNTVTATIKVGDSPRGVSVTPDGAKVYVPNYWDNTVSVIDTTTNTVIATVNAGSRPCSFGQFIGPVLAQKIFPVANFSSNVTEGYAPLSVQYNDYSENATSVNWDFGDGINSTEKNPMYTYFAAGNYTVNLTAANENGTNSTFATITVLEKPVSNWEFSPQKPVRGDTLNINGSAFSGEKVDVLVTFEKTVPVSSGKFEYTIEDVMIPEGFNNFFTVETCEAKNLNLRVKKNIWVTKSSEASRGTAIVSQSNVPPGTYRIKIDGNAERGYSKVNLKIKASQKVKVDSNGTFNCSYDTTAIPPGNFKINIGGIKKEITLKHGK